MRPYARRPCRPRGAADCLADACAAVARGLSARSFRARVSAAAPRPVAVGGEGVTGPHPLVTGATTGPAAPAPVVTLEWDAWPADVRAANAVVAAVAAEWFPLPFGAATRHVLRGRGEITPARVGARVGRCYSPTPEDRMAQPTLADEVVKAVREALQADPKNWEPGLKTRLARLFTAGEFKDGDLLTAERLNVLLRTVRELQTDVAALKQREPTATTKPPVDEPYG